MDIELRHLRAFAAVARRGSFTGAAEQLGITQPALSRTVRQLEDRVGAELLTRTTRRLEVNEAGARLLPAAEAALVAFDRALEAVRDDDSVTLGFAWLLPEPWAQRTMELAAERGIQVRLRRCDRPMDDVRTGRADLVVCREPVDVDDLQVVHLLDETRVAAASVESSLAGRSSVRWGELARWPLVVNTVNGTTRADTVTGVGAGQEVVECASFDEWLAYVAANRGIGIVPSMARERAPHPRVEYLEIEDAPALSVHLAYRRGARNRALRHVVECALDVAGGREPTGRHTVDP